MKKTLAYVLALAMIIGMLPMVAMAAGTVHEVTDTDTLKSAITAAADGDTIKLMNDFTLEEKISINKNITIDGNGVTITGVEGSVYNSGYSLNAYFEVVDGTFTISNATLTDFGKNTGTNSGITVFSIPASAATTAEIVATGLTVKNFCRSAFDIRSGSFEITDCEIDCDNGQGSAMLTKAIQVGFGTNTVTGTIDGVTVTGASSDYNDWSSAGIEVFAPSNVTVKNCEITEVENGIHVDGYWGTGSSAATIENCTVDATDNALRVYEYTNVTATGAAMTVTGGSYTGGVAIVSNLTTSNATLDISGGQYSVDVTEFVTSGSTLVEDGNGNFYIPGTPGAPVPVYGGPVMNQNKIAAAQNGYVKTSPIAASEGATITIYVFANEGYEMSEVTVLDKNGDAVELTQNAAGRWTYKLPLGGVSVAPVFTAK